MNNRILIVVQNLSVPKDRRVWLEAQALVRRGYEVSVICPREAKDSAYEKIDGVEIWRCRIPNSSSRIYGYFLEYTWSFAVMTAKIVRLHARRRFAAIQVCNPPDFFFHIGWLCRATRTAFIYDQHDLCPELLLTKFPTRKGLLYRSAVAMEGLTCRAASRVICTNTSYAAIARQRHNVPAQKLQVVRNGPVLKDFAKGRPEPKLKGDAEYLIVFCGAIAEQDGADVLVRAAQQILLRGHRTDVRFAIVGDGPALTGVKQLAQDLGVGQWIDFPGWVLRRQVVQYMLTADVCVSPEPSNPLNDKSTFIKVLEYMAAGKPVVAFDLPETRASAGAAAIYARPNSVTELAANIEKLLDEPQTRAAMGAEAASRAKSLLAWETSEQVFLHVYDSLLALPAPSEI